jgi:hypothetical protein
MFYSRIFHHKIPYRVVELVLISNMYIQPVMGIGQAPDIPLKIVKFSVN